MIVPALAAGLLLVSACSAGTDADGSDAVGPAAADAGAGTDDDPDAAEAERCPPGALPTLTEEILTVGTSVPYEPWFVGDDPTTGEGFESALVYSLAEELGYDGQEVIWEDITFEQIVSPSVKPFDFAVYQTSITPERAEAVDFSSPYLTTRQGVLVQQDGPYAAADALADLHGARVGVTASQTSLTIAEQAWGDDVTLVPYDDAGAAMQALQNDQIQVVVMDVDQGASAASQYFPDSMVLGTLPNGGVTEQLGLVLDLDSELTECVSAAVDALAEDGTLERLRTQWLGSDDFAELG